MAPFETFTEYGKREASGEVYNEAFIQNAAVKKRLSTLNWMMFFDPRFFRI